MSIQSPTTPPLSIVILAAGKGTRMKSDKAKVLHELFYAPMVHHVVEATLPLAAMRTVIIVGHQRQQVQQSLSSYHLEYAEQEEQLGTGHAVLMTENFIPEDPGTVLILCGDTPLIRTWTLDQMYREHLRSKAKLTVMTTIMADPTNYGRVVTDKDGLLISIVEEKDATPVERAITEINAGVYCVDRSFLFWALAQVDTNNSQGEVYLTDIVSLAVQAGENVNRYVADQGSEVLGVNSRVELAQAHAELQRRHNREVMLSGVTLVHPETIAISPCSKIGRDTRIMPGCAVERGTRIGSGCLLNQGVLLHNCSIGNNVTIGGYAVLCDTNVPDNTVVAPHATSP